MREILFRGKSIKYDRWFYGYFVEDLSGKSFIWSEYNLIEVIPDTVCEFTGLYDKNCKKIFEGDIIQNEHKEIKVVEYIQCYFFPFVSFPEYTSWDNDKCEVIGNIFDNKE